MRRALKYTILLGLIAISSLALLVATATFLRPRLAIELLQHLIPVSTPTPIQIIGIGVIGDSLSDEYRADDSRGVTYAPTTLNWVEILARTRNLPFGKWQYWEEPRRQGYEYNFARTSATLNRALTDGQHTGLAQEISAGKVNIVIVFIGANDFFPYLQGGYESIYNGSMSDAQILQKVNRMAADEETIIETLQKAGTVRILLVKVLDWDHHPAAPIAFPDPTRRQKVTEVIQRVNDKFEKLAEEKGIATADPNAFYNSLQLREKNGKIMVGKVALDRFMPSDEPHSFFLDDIIHPGTVVNGLFANFIVENLNAKLGTNIRPLSDDEILTAAGL